jgi:hypothetical protein
MLVSQSEQSSGNGQLTVRFSERLASENATVLLQVQADMLGYRVVSTIVRLVAARGILKTDFLCIGERAKTTWTSC